MLRLLKPFLIVGLVLVAVLGGLGWYQLVYKPAKVEASLASFKPPPVTISATTAKAETWQPVITSVGTLRAVNGVDIAPQVDGIVTKLSFDSGHDVKAGALLLELDTAVEEAQLRSLQASLRDARLELDRKQKIFNKGDIAKAALDAVQTQHDRATAAVDRTKAIIEQKRIRAPFDGRIGIREVDLGQYLSSGTVVVNLQSLDPIFVDFTVPEQDLDKLKPGQVVTITVDAVPGRTFSGSLSAIDAKVDRNTRNIRVRATFKNPDHVLVPGLFANVSVHLPQSDKIVTVPETAVTYSLYGETVFLITDPPKEKAKDGSPVLVVNRHPVRTGKRRGDSVAIVEGLKPGQRVVTSGQIKLQDGTHVRIDNSVVLTPQRPRPKE